MQVHETIKGHSRIDFNKKRVRRAMRQAGGIVRKAARRLVSRRGVSGAGEYPGRDSGVLMRSIQVKVSRSGFMARVQPFKTAAMQEFYPAFLHYGTPTMDERENFMVDALDSTQAATRSVIREGLFSSLEPR